MVLFRVTASVLIFSFMDMMLHMVPNTKYFAALANHLHQSLAHDHFALKFYFQKFNFGDGLSENIKIFRYLQKCVKRSVEKVSTIF